MATAPLAIPGSDNSNGTQDQAEANAQEWLAQIRAAGIHGVQIVGSPFEHGGIWSFNFRHSHTDVTCELRTHGLTADQWAKSLLPPVVTWNGTPGGLPCADDWLPEGWTWSVVYRDWGVWAEGEV